MRKKWKIKKIMRGGVEGRGSDGPGGGGGRSQRLEIKKSGGPAREWESKSL